MNKNVKIIIVILLLLGIGTFSFFYWGTYSEGVRAGVIMKLSHKGAILKTYEGQLNMEGFGATKSNNQFSQTWEFSVEKDLQDVIQKLEDASLSGERVNLHYIERYWKVPWRGETKFFIRDVESQNE